ncbi:hypothetical protein SAMN04487771_102747 [[Clostridium] aminophilum]|uniref:Uncharacterized protein n=1 Tax=[Clostridium] aminophilum TaxID=1526 RepID=A0A1I0FR68_9FIRM|nr:hypothetical protein SAMN04487771_102747 [[Clostridium] aminophilum]
MPILIILFIGDLLLYAVIPVTIDLVNHQYTDKSTVLQMLGHFILSNFTTSDCGYQLFQIRDLSDIGCLIDEASDMNWKSAAIHIIGLLTKQIEKLTVDHGNQEIKGSICITHNEK